MGLLFIFLELTVANNVTFTQYKYYVLKRLNIAKNNITTCNAVLIIQLYLLY